MNGGVDSSLAAAGAWVPGTGCSRGPTPGRTSPTCSSRSRRPSWDASACQSESTARRLSAGSPPRPGCPWPASPTARRYASSRTATTGDSSATERVRLRGGHSGRLRQRPRHPPGHTVLHRRPARGLGLNGNRGSPTYVIDIDAESNTVTVGAEEELLRTRLWASRMSFTSGSPPREPIEVPAEIRYKASEAPATVSPDGEWLRIDFHDPSAR